MKMGAFLLGGIVGAAAVMYMNRGGSWSFAGMSDMFGTSMNGAKANQRNNRHFRSSSSSSHTRDMSRDNGRNAGRDDADFKEMENMIKSDPNVKKEVDEILGQSGRSYTQ
ncbi:hypothetical protein [Paenibacillus ginsengarvi]|uniref:Uncharacterized protein n=1 Tax=Paenibacillus ginsengarvi TaxID=400777 RepID=A0A3B0CF58_9BACL|nr:hypothetical protein [Paenibacillus ginsengarvi]RKN84615.1 hypothetical protein D7M11_11505 [Paenibacillus ginsengarvi]